MQLNFRKSTNRSIFIIMRALFLLAAISLVAAGDNNSNYSCPLWQYRPHEDQPCRFGEDINGALVFSEHKVYLRFDYVMSWDNRSNQLVVAYSRYGYHNNTEYLRGYSLVPSDITEVTTAMCKPNNREDFLCEKCLPNYGSSAYWSKCSKCNHSLLVALAIFISTKLFPIVVLFLLIMTFRIDVTQGPMLGYILYCQVHVLVDREVSPLFYHYIKHRHIIMDASLYASAVWNLDFLQITRIIPPFCISPHLWDYDILLLNNISVLLPLCLVVLTYLFIELHARNVLIAVYCWKPFHNCFVKVRRNWSATDSVIHAYASLFLLSFPLLNYNAYQILKSTDVYDVSGVIYRNVLVNHPSIHVYTLKYIYYGTITFMLLFFFGVCPSLLLLLYSIQLCRRKLQRCCSQRLVIGLNTFVETFQGPFKNGCNETRDYRILPGIVACAVLLITTLGSLKNVFHYNSYFSSFFVAFFAFISVFFAYTHPCKSVITNLSFTFHSMWIAAIGAIFVLWLHAPYLDSRILLLLLYISVPVPHILMLLWVLYKIDTKVGHLGQKSAACFSFVMGWIKFRKQCIYDDSPELPDRLLNSQDYHELT